jgi:hypothetical protein
MGCEYSHTYRKETVHTGNALAVLRAASITWRHVEYYFGRVPRPLREVVRNSAILAAKVAPSDEVNTLAGGAINAATIERFLERQGAA